MGKKTRKRRKLSLKKQVPRRLDSVDQHELAEVSGGYEPTLSPTITYHLTSTISSVDHLGIIRYTQRCDTTGCS